MTEAPLADALRGIRVLDLSRLLPGPFLTMVLADMGADVVKIEDPRIGDYLRAFPPAKGGLGGRFLAVHRGKRSLAPGLQAPAGPAAFLRPPARPDLVVGSLWGATAILGALVGRERTGRGAHLDISMTEGALALLAAELGNLECGARPTRGVEALNGGMACYGVYRTADRRYLAVGALEPKF